MTHTEPRPGRRPARLLWLTCLSVALVAPAPAQLTEVVLHNFGAAAPGGSEPEATVIRDAAGNLYGTAAQGGDLSFGVVYKVGTKGIETVLHTFTGGADGAFPFGALVLDSAGNLYGTASSGAQQNCPFQNSGSQYGCGVVFKLDPANHLTVLHTFTGKEDGGNPYAGVTLDSSGNLYGTASYGGAAQRGVLFKIDSNGRETVLHNFSGFGGLDGEYPIAGVIFDAAGNLYGTTANGGLSSSLFRYGCGVVYKVTPSGQETVLYAFPCRGNGALPSAGNLALDSAGNLYGTTYYGGLGISGGSAEGYGVVYKLDSAGRQTLLYQFTGRTDGANPNGGVILDSAGNLYGTTYYGGLKAGFESYGVVFKLDTSGHQTVLHRFASQPDGSNPDAGVILDPAGNIYGTTATGGPGNLGAVFKLSAAGHVTTFNCFTGALGGNVAVGGLLSDAARNLYGITRTGGKANLGTVYQFDAAGRETVLYGFSGGAAGEHPGVYTGAYASKGVVRDAAGNLYGIAAAGGTAGGEVLFKVAPTGQETVLYSVASGYYLSQVTFDGTGSLYGTVANGGPSYNGLVFKVTAAGQQSVLYTFSGLDGAGPLGGLVLDAAGNFYGATQAGGVSSQGVVFKLDPSGSETVLYNFTGGTDGGYPGSGVTFDSAGNLYGTTTAGGTHGQGVVYKLDTNGQETVLYNFAIGSFDGNSYSDLVLDAAGNLYGTSAASGAPGCALSDGCGYVYKVDPAGQETTLYTFTGGADGANPTGPVIFDAAGNLYGTTNYGGANNGGVIFELIGAAARH